METEEKRLTSREFVLQKYPDASCHGPVNTYWPGEGERKGVWIVTTHISSSATFSSADNEELAWERAATRVQFREFTREIELLKKEIEQFGQSPKERP